MTKEEYLNIKKYIKTLSRPTINDLCTSVGISESDKQLLYQLSENRTRTYTCINLGYSEWFYTESLKRIFVRINDYLKRTSE